MENSQIKKLSTVLISLLKEGEVGLLAKILYNHGIRVYPLEVSEKPVAEFRLKYLRTSLGMTLEQLSQKLDMPLSTLAGYENGRREAPYKVLIKISRFFGVSIDYLLGQ